MIYVFIFKFLIVAYLIITLFEFKRKISLNMAQIKTLERLDKRVFQTDRYYMIFIKFKYLLLISMFLFAGYYSNNNYIILTSFFICLKTFLNIFNLYIFKIKFNLMRYRINLLINLIIAIVLYLYFFI